MKRLEQMTLDELWQLFPIIISPHNPLWNEWAKEEIHRLSGILSEFSPVITHIGSTAIPSIQAKPIIDILVEVNPHCDSALIKNAMKSSGYICMNQSPSRMSFNKGYTPEGYAQKVFHIHVHNLGDNDEILFRDYLIEHPERAKEYEALKLSLLPKYRHDRDGYTAAKTAFVNTTLQMARIHSH